MSFSSTLYRIPGDFFRQIADGLIKPQELAKKSKDFVTIQDSSDAIKFILKKRGKNMDNLINEIFFPEQSIGSVSDEEFQKLIASNNYKEIDRITASTVYFLPPTKVTALNTFLDSLDQSEIKTLYDSDELNENDIYPSLWTPGEDHDKAYNLSHVQNDLASLKNLFKDASIEEDYIVAFNG